MEKKNIAIYLNNIQGDFEIESFEIYEQIDGFEIIFNECEKDEKSLWIKKVSSTLPKNFKSIIKTFLIKEVGEK